MQEDLIRKLAAFEPTEMPVLSVYLDMRPQATGESPGIRSGEIVLRARLHEIANTYRERGNARDCFLADRERIEEFVRRDMSPATSGLIIFACSAKGLWESVEVGAELENEVTVGPVPELYQLAKMLDEHETVVVAVVDTNNARFFVTRYGRLNELDGPDDPNVQDYSKPSGGGWRQKRYQTIVDNKRRDFSQQVVEELEALIERVEAKNLVIAGNETTMTLLQDNLSPSSKKILYSEVLRIDQRAPRLDIKKDVMRIVDEIEKEKDLSLAEKLVGAIRGDGLGVAGLDATAQALKNGQVAMLLLNPSIGVISDTVRNQLIRLAVTTGANVDMVEDNETSAITDGVGALLRYKFQYAGALPAGR